jgi:hypothetical protein
MFDFLVYLMINSFWLAAILAVVLFTCRVYISITFKEKKGKLGLIIGLPCSIGVYLYAKDHPWIKIYELLVILQFILIFLASIFILYLRLELNII